jgi:hypothetical protein
VTTTVTLVYPPTPNQRPTTPPATQGEDPGVSPPANPGGSNEPDQSASQDDSDLQPIVVTAQIVGGTMSQSTSSGSLIEGIVVVATRINTAIGNVASTLEHGRNLL